MRRLLLTRLASALPTLAGVTLVAFAVAALAPGDPAAVMLQRQTGELPSDAAVAVLRASLHLDDPLPVRYARWVGDAATGDLGRSFRTGETVTTLLVARVPSTAVLALTAVAAAHLVGVPLGLLAAARAGTIIDRGARVLVLVGDSWPSYVVAYVLLITFGVGLGWLPVAGADSWRSAVLPAATLAFGLVSGIVRVTRAGVLDVLGREHVRMARARGVTSTGVLWRHALPSASLLLLTFSSLRLAQLLGGVVIVETVFAWPGLGQALVAAVFDRDYPVLQALVLYSGVTLVAMDAATDAALSLADPRIRIRG